MGLQCLEVDIDKHVGLAVCQCLGGEARPGHQRAVVRVAQPVRLLDRIGVDPAERFRCHVDEGGDILLHEVGCGMIVDLLQARAKLRLRL
ncbi:hypothetical protein D3C73_1326780 [compost metagenome]